MHFKYLPSFVKRRGRITKKQIENIEDLHKFSVSNFNDIKNISEDFTSTTIEIGFGDGENIFSIAKGNPETYLLVQKFIFQA